MIWGPDTKLHAQFKVLRMPSIEIQIRNWELEVLFSKFHRRTNLLVLLFSNCGSKKQNYILRHSKLGMLRLPNTDTKQTFCVLNVKQFLVRICMGSSHGMPNLEILTMQFCF
jgi:hypothetical protein